MRVGKAAAAPALDLEGAGLRSAAVEDEFSGGEEEEDDEDAQAQAEAEVTLKRLRNFC